MAPQAATADATTDPERRASLELDISGMTCASCAARIEKKLNKVDGVTASVNYATEKAKVTVPAGYDPGLLVAEVEKTGYTAALPAPKNPQPDRRTGEDADESDPELTSLRHRLIGSIVLCRFIHDSKLGTLLLAMRDGLFRFDPATGQLTTQPGQVVSPSSCLGCWTQCGVRVRVDTQKGEIIRIAGNPYHPLATTHHAPMETPVREVYAMLGGDNGLEGRATSCARGSAMFEHQTAPHRVLQPLKRVGPRGSGQWKTIAFEDLVKEICEGGDLFGEGHVDGLAAIRDVQTLIDPENPEYGPKANQLNTLRSCT